MKFCTFADRSLNKSLNRIALQARSLNRFNEIRIYNDSKIGYDFKLKYGNIINEYPRGYGYWVWKPYIIFQTLLSMNDGDILLYADSGCWINSKGTLIFDEYIHFLSQSNYDFLFFDPNLDQLNAQNGFFKYDLSESTWSKNDIFHFFNTDKNIEFKNSQQLAATSFFVKKTTRSIELIKYWQSLWQTNFELIDDSPSISTNSRNFIENRHDQSILSSIIKIEGFLAFPLTHIFQPKPILSYDAIDARSYTASWDDRSIFPIQARRDKQYSFVKKLQIKKDAVLRRLNAIF